LFGNDDSRRKAKRSTFQSGCRCCWSPSLFARGDDYQSRGRNRRRRRGKHDDDDVVVVSVSVCYTCTGVIKVRYAEDKKGRYEPQKTRSLSLNFLENALFSITVKNKKEKRTSHHITSHHARKRNEEEKRK